MIDDTRTPLQVIAASDDVARAVAVVRGGGVIAIPTDTVYGLAASMASPQAIERIFSIKGRAGTKAIPVLVGGQDELLRYGAAVSDTAKRLAAAFWPGALTIVIQASDAVPDAILRGGSTVGLRMPDRTDTLAIIAGAGGALAVTSANRSGDREARSADDVRAKLGGRVDFVVDGGESPLSMPSTVVDVTGNAVRILRQGSISRSALASVVESEGDSWIA